MNHCNSIEASLQAADSALLLRTAADAARAAKAWHRCPLLGLDTEFVRERTYFANLGLVQISDGHTVWLLDPLQPGTLEPLKQLLQDRGVVKVFHSPSEDLEVLQHTVGALPEPLVDTQAACALLGKPLQMGYHTAVEWMFDVVLDKEQTRSNWCARPLRKEQMHYAALDVCLLPAMWLRLQKQLDQQGRLQWLQEDCARALQRARDTVPENDLWRRIGGAGRLDGQSLAVLQALAAWREQQAKKLNRPRGFIVADTVLISVAERRLREPHQVEQLEGLHPKAARRYRDKMAEIVRETLDSGHTVSVLPKLTPGQRRLLKRMKAHIQEKANELGLEPAVLASSKELEEFALTRGSSLPDRLRGWRMQVITRDLSEMLQE